MFCARMFAFVMVVQATSSCVTKSEEDIAVVKANKDPKYSSLRKGTRYAIFVADQNAKRNQATDQMENDIKESLSSKGLVLVDYEQTSLSNILRANGAVTEGQAKLVSSSVDLVVTGRVFEDDLDDANMNKSGTFRTRLRVSVAVVEANSAIEKIRFSMPACEAMASSFQSASVHAAAECGPKVADKLVEKLLDIYGE